MRKKLAILGSTGSIGVSALDVVAQHPDMFEVVALAAGSNYELLSRQIKKFAPRLVSVKDTGVYEDIKMLCGDSVNIVCGPEGTVQVATVSDADMVLSAIVGAAGLVPTYEAIKAGKDIALANKETLVAAGEIVMDAAKKYNVKILPVDSEHSAVFQSLVGHKMTDVNKIILTASGGPFWNYTGDLEKVTVEQALKHPNWSMGAKITIDSATMMNKGLEIIEAKWLFDLPEDKIEVVIHPQSIIHSMVEYKDSSIVAQLARPDMRGPISYALSYPDRIVNNVESINWARLSTLTFAKPDTERFPMLDLARQAIKAGGAIPAAMNSANEMAVQAFIDRKIGFLDIYNVVLGVVEKYNVCKVSSIEDVLAADQEGRRQAREMINEMRSERNL